MANHRERVVKLCKAKDQYTENIPANFFSVKCVRFFVSTVPKFPKIANVFERLPKIAEDF